MTEADCIPRSATNPRSSSKPISPGSQPSERTNPKLSLKCGVSLEGRSPSPCPRIHVLSGRRPLSRVSSRFCEHLGCGHVFGLFARVLDPLALMVRPRGSLPQSPYRVRYDADTLSGFRAYPSVHITPWSPSIPDRLAAKFLSRQPFFRPRQVARRIRRRASSARRRCARLCWRTRPRSA